MHAAICKMDKRFGKLQAHMLAAAARHGSSSSSPNAPEAAEAKAEPAARTCGQSARPDACSSGGRDTSRGAGSSSSAGGKAKAAGAATGVRQCWACGKQAGPDQTLHKCSGCRRALYCTKDCQAAGWKVHKAECRKWAAQRAAAKDAGKH